VVQSVLVEVTLTADEAVVEETSEVFAELHDVEKLHFLSGLGNEILVLHHDFLDPLPSEEPRKNVGFLQDCVGPVRTEDIVRHRVGPFHKGFTPLPPHFGVGVFILVDVILVAALVEDAVDDPVDDLPEPKSTMNKIAMGRP
jgi:hypothetical protein